MRRADSLLQWKDTAVCEGDELVASVRRRAVTRRCAGHAAHHLRRLGRRHRRLAFSQGRASLCLSANLLPESVVLLWKVRLLHLTDT